jgi:hypothetical protein
MHASDYTTKRWRWKEIEKKKKGALTQSELNEKFMMKPRYSHKKHIEKEINKFKVEC